MFEYWFLVVVDDVVVVIKWVIVNVGELGGNDVVVVVGDSVGGNFVVVVI